MKKLFALLLTILMGTQSIYGIEAAKPIQVAKNLFTYITSAHGIKAISAAYVLQIILNLMHEVGHATAGKLLYGAPFDITLGSHQETEKNIIKVGWLKINSFNPCKAFAYIESNNRHPLKEMTISLAGPVFGATSSVIAYLALKKYNSDSVLSLSKGIACGNILSNTLLENGLLSGLYFLAPKFFSFLGFFPYSDFNLAVAAFQEYRNSTI